jgi:hypothetical protein
VVCLAWLGLGLGLGRVRVRFWLGLRGFFHPEGFDSFVLAFYRVDFKSPPSNCFGFLTRA